MASNLKLESFSDRELLHLLDDLAGEDGWVDVEIMAARVGLSADGMSDEQLAFHARRCVSVRLAWIKRLSGCVERHPLKERLAWRLTASGQQVVNARISVTLVESLERIGEYSALLALGHLGRRYNRADASSANLMRREWTHGTHRKRRG
jgi:hypothetical protein